MIQQIENNESGSSVRSKLNEIIKQNNGIQSGSGIDVIVGQNGINTIGQALEVLTLYKKVYQPGYGTPRCTITINSNFTMNETIAVSGQNLGWIEIRVTSGVVTIAQTQENSITEYQPSDTMKVGFFAKNGGVLPVLSGKFTLADSGADALVGLYGPGSTCILRSRNTVLDGGGFNHTVSVIYGARFVARDCTIQNSGPNGNVLNVTNMSEAIINECIITGAGNEGNAVNAVRGSRIVLHRSTVDSTNSDASSEIYISG